MKRPTQRLAVPVPDLLRSLLFMPRSSQRKNLQFDRGDPGLGHRQFLGGRIGEVDDASLVTKISTIRNPNHHRPFVLQIHHPDHRAERQSRMAGSHRIHVKSFSAGRMAAIEYPPIPGGDSVEHFSRITSCGFPRRNQGRRRACYRNRRGSGCRWPGKHRIRMHCPRGDTYHHRGQRNRRSSRQQPYP